MGTLRLAAALAAIAVPAAAKADQVERWHELIAQASSRFGVPADRVERVMRAESAGRTTLAGKPIRSRKGAMGLMQLMPATWSVMRERLHLGTDPDNPVDNIAAGVAYLRIMQDRFGYPGMFAAYNMGPGGYARYLAGAGRLPAETVAYLNTLTGRERALVTTQTTPQSLLFALRPGGGSTPFSVRSPDQPAGLFAIRTAVP